MKKNRIRRCFALLALLLFLAQPTCSVLATEGELLPQDGTLADPRQDACTYCGNEEEATADTMAVSAAAEDAYATNGKAGLDPCWLNPDFAEGDYTMVVLPDTQFMVGTFTDAYYTMMHWIADNRDTLNIQAVMHMGDMVNKNNATERTIPSVWKIPAIPKAMIYGKPSNTTKILYLL